MTYVCVCEHWEYYKEGQQAGRINKKNKKAFKALQPKTGKTTAHCSQIPSLNFFFFPLLSVFVILFFPLPLSLNRLNTFLRYDYTQKAYTELHFLFILNLHVSGKTKTNGALSVPPTLTPSPVAPWRRSPSSEERDNSFFVDRALSGVY